jgi:peptidoglycan/xylan/chitin deacetylase (PgdA/CDA1 family)
MIPHRTPFLLPLLYPSLTWRLEEHTPVLYLTFDDGPVPGPTEFVLDCLSREELHGTFFCIGDNIRKHPGIFERILADGHTVGNHTCNHVNGWRTSTEDYLLNAQAFEAAARNAGLANRTALFRPPYGRITRQQIKALRDYRIVMWDVLSQDYNKHLSQETCLRRTLRACRPGSIIVFHDSYKSERNMKFVLPRLIDQARTQGYAFGSLRAAST